MTGRRAFGLILALIIAMAAISAAAIGVGRAGAASFESTGFQNCVAQSSIRPCFMSVLPGITLWSEARRALGSKLRRTDETVWERYSWLSPEGVNAQFWSYTGFDPDRPVSYIRVLPLQNGRLMGLGPFVAYFGPPCAIYPFGTGSHGVALFYPTMRLIVTLSKGDRLDLDSAILEVQMADPDTDRRAPSGTQILGSCTSQTVQRWIGFNTLRRYRAHWDNLDG